ncbi:MAG: Gfo/Idh/MocA family protein [Tepidisphaerales bacterium]
MKDQQYHPVKRIARRAFLKSAGAGALALGLPRLGLAASPGSNPSGANDQVRIAVVGIGSKEAVGGVGGRGRQLINALANVQGVRIVALCDVDQGILARQAGQLKDQGQPVAVYGDLRRVFDDKSVDAVIVATPNHWHALATVWACQAGKDVYVEKPISHNIWEGRQMVAAARKGGRIVQTGTQARSSSVLREAFDWVQRGELGPIRFARVIVYRQRSGIGKVAEPTPIPGDVDYDLWCGPAEKQPLRRKQLHYDWHWVWSTGSGEMGNNGVHYIDLCRRVMKLDASAPRVMSLGGRFSFDDDGETPNTQVAILDYQPAPIYCEIRCLPEKKGSQAMDSFQKTQMGVVIQCEGGYFAGAHLSGAAFDNQGKEIRKFGPTTWADMDGGHLANFVEAMRSRKAGSLHADVLEGHLSTACCHQVGISHRLGQTAPPGTVLERPKANPLLADAVARYREHLRANEIDFAAKEILGPWLTFDTKQERFTGEFAAEANSLLTRAYRKPFVVPQIA